MKKVWNGIQLWVKRRSAVFVLLAAALLVELVSALQYYDSRNRLREALEERVVGDLRIKALYIKRTLTEAEVALGNHVWDAERLLASPDSMPDVCRRVVESNSKFNSCGLAFKPGFYPSKDVLFEPYACRNADGVVEIRQIASEHHDYTRLDFYRDAIQGDTAFWCQPYLDREGAGGIVTTFALPVCDSLDEPVAAFAIDLHVDWMGEELNVRHLYPSSFAILLDEDGTLIARPSSDSVSVDNVKWLVGLINDSTVSRKLTKNERATVIEFSDGRYGDDGYIFYAYLRGKPRWQLAIVCYDDEVFADLRQMRLNMFILAVLGLVLLGFILHRSAKNIRQLERANVEREKMDSELRVAQNIQMQLLPTDGGEPVLGRTDLDICGSLLPAKEVGGDLYDFFVRDEKMFFCIGDVSGKGVPSALLMAVTHTLFRTAAAHETNPQRIVQTINEMSCQGNEANMFVTLFVGVLDLPTGRLRYCNAGHDCPAVRTEGWELLPAKANLPVGIIDDFKYMAQEIRLAAGATLFLYTDGLTEAMDCRHAQFGLQRMQNVLAELDEQGDWDASRLLTTMQEAVHRFTEGAEQSDDLTMLAFRYLPHEETVVVEECVVLTNNVNDVPRLNAFVASLTDRLQMEASKAGQVKLAVEEAVVNVMHYAYPPEMEGEIEVRAEANDQRLKFVISDSGVAFDPTQTLAADTTLSAEERPIGGLGIFLVRQLMDSINYERTEGRNVLTLRKSL